MTRRPASLPHTGIATFAKAPYVEDLAALDADVAVMGVPFDAAVGMRPGCRQAPRAIRDASTRFGFLGQRTAGYYDTNADAQALSGVRFADCGDAEIAYYDVERNLQAIELMAREILGRGALPVVLGGDHSISYPVIRAFEAHAPLTIVLFDAHLDYKDDVMGLRLTNNSPFRRAHELPFVEQIISFGIRGIKSTDRDLREARRHGHLAFTSHDVQDLSIERLMSQLPTSIGSYYVSIDIDALDPSIAPGTESPEADGLSYRHVKDLLVALADRGRLVGLDVVEVNPYLDHAELTQHIAAQILIEGIASAF